MSNNVQIIGLNELELTNDDLFVRIPVSNYDSNTKIVVYETHSAILLKNGILQETLEAGEYPLFEVKHGLFKDRKLGASTVDLIYVSKSAELPIKWGTPSQFTFRDPITQVPVRLGACGEIGVKVNNARKFYCELIGTKTEFTLDDLKERLRSRLLNEVEPLIAKVMREKQITYAEFTEHKQEVEKGILPVIKKMFNENYGINVTYFVISNIIIDENDRDELERELRNIRIDERNDKKKLTDREDYLWWINEAEKFKDDETKREELLNKLREQDYNKFVNVCAAISEKEDEKEEEEKQRYCPNCGEPVTMDAKFCANCGEKLVQANNICKACGKENPVGSKFCSNCGEKL